MISETLALALMLASLGVCLGLFVVGSLAVLALRGLREVMDSLRRETRSGERSRCL